MRGFKGERTLVRIHIGSKDRWQGRPLHEAIVALLRAQHLAGATVMRGIEGFGASAIVHKPAFARSSDAPIVVEFVETQEQIDRILPTLDEMIGGGLITLERAKVIMYRADKPVEERTGSWPIDLGDRDPHGRDEG